MPTCYRLLFTDRNRHFNQKDFEADVFAMCLLMPKNKVIKTYRQTNSIEEVSRHFNVPIDVAAFRLNMLNLID